MSKKRALVICPGRGTYNKEELGYFGRHHPDQQAMLGAFDAKRRALGQTPLAELDQAARYALSSHSRGDNASALIYACALADFRAINRDQYDITAITGNSMGWYIALACAGACDADTGFDIVNTMGTMMQQSLIGGQLLYPFVDENWVEIPGKRAELLALTEQIEGLYVSIHLGGMVVFAGLDQALRQAESALPPVQGRFPMRLQNHAGFHSVLQQPNSQQALADIPADWLTPPQHPMIDGRGHIWYPGANRREDIHRYTFGTQVVEIYDFTKAVQNSLKEFAPEVVIVLGPGNTLGGAVAQAMIDLNWQGMSCKADFQQQQQAAPLLLAMGLPEQRALVL